PSHPVDDQRRRFCHIGVRKRRKNGRKKGLTTPDKSGTDCVQPRTRKGCFPSARLSVPKRPMEKPDTSAVAEVSLNRYLLFPVTIHSDRVCGETTDVSSECAPTRTPAEGNRARAITAAAASMTGINPIHTINHPERAEPTRSVPVKIGVTKP